jgi:4-hydroxyphenylpyruvate dioxygenase
MIATHAIRARFSPLVGVYLIASSFDAVASLSTTAAYQPPKWQPKIQSLEKRRKLRGLRHDSEHIGTVGFHHVEFYCGDAKSMAYRFSQALGMPIVGVTGQSTGNDQCVSYALESGDVRFLLTAPYSLAAASSSAPDSGSNASINEADNEYDAPDPLPGFSPTLAHAMFSKHGIFARAVGVEVKDAEKAFAESVARGATPILQPTVLANCLAQRKAGVASSCCVSEVQLYGDVVLRYVSFSHSKDTQLTARSPFLPHLAPMYGKISKKATFGLRCIDHAVGNVPNLQEALDRISAFTGFHEFAEFTMADVGTVDSGLNSVVLASDMEDVLLPLNEPTEGRRKSQIQTYLEQNEGPGLQHLALKTDDIFSTIRHLREMEEVGGFELMTRPSDGYYRELPQRLGDKLSSAQYADLEELGILADADDEGILLQIFTKPIGDRPTFFFEIIQRVGCEYRLDDSDDSVIMNRPGCGGFGQGNFRELFKAIEEHEKTLKV